MKRLFGSVVCFTLIAAGLGTAVQSDAWAIGPITVSVGDVTAVEGDAGIATISIPVDLSAPAAVTVKVPYSVVVSSDGTADAADAQLKKGTVSFGIGTTTKSVGVASVGDTTIEPDQHVLIVLGTPVGGSVAVADGTGVLTLVDDDTNGVSPNIEVSIGDIILTEADQGVHKGFIPITLSRPATVVTKIGFTMDCLAASSIDDVTLQQKGTVTFQVGQRSKSLPFLVSANNTPEQIAQITQRITSFVSTVKVLDNRGDATINDDDGSLPTYQGYPVPGFVASNIVNPSPFDEGQAVGENVEVSVDSAGAPGSYPSNGTAPNNAGSFPIRNVTTSANGRYVAYVSEQLDLVPGDTNGLADVFVLDRATNVVERVNVKNDGTQTQLSDGYNGTHATVGTLSISDDGRYVAFETNATLTAQDGVAASWVEAESIYIRDRVAGTTALGSIGTSGQSVPAVSPTLSADGRYLLFKGNGDRSVYMNDRIAAATTLVFANSFSNWPVMSANGRYVVTTSTGISCTDVEVVLIDVVDGATERIDVTDDGVGATQGTGFYGFSPVISADGRYVAFKSNAWNLIPGLSEAPGPYSGAFDSSTVHVYVRDRQQLSTTMVGLGTNGVVPPPVFYDSYLAMDGPGSLLAVSSWSATPAQLFDLGAGTSATVLPPNSGAQYSEVRLAFNGAMSRDGRYLVYASGRAGTIANTYNGEAYVQRIR